MVHHTPSPHRRRGRPRGVALPGMIIAILPIVVVLVLLQKYVFKGFASGLQG